MQLLNLEGVLLLELFQTQVGCGFVVTHIVIPGARKLQELCPLGTFDSNEFLFLGLTHVLQLPKHFLVLQVLKLELGTPSFGEIHVFAALAAVVVQKPISNRSRPLT